MNLKSPGQTSLTGLPGNERHHVGGRRGTGQGHYRKKGEAREALDIYTYLRIYPLQAIEELSAEKLMEYREIFSFFDRDGGGSIGAEEFQQVMRTFGWDPREDELKVARLCDV